MKTFIRAFFYKNGEFSKTAVFLTAATFILLALWPFQALFAGTELLGWWTVPEFNATAAMTVLFGLGSLYAVNHGWVNKDKGASTEQVQQIQSQLEGILNRFSGKEESE